jgi:hypothetical protein
MNFAIGVMGWSVTVMMSPIQMSSRLENLQNLLLTAVAFKFAVSDSLPNLPFMTVLDQYVLVNFVFLFLQTLETYIVGGMTLSIVKGREYMHFQMYLMSWGINTTDYDDWMLEGVTVEKWWIRIAG